MAKTGTQIQSDIYAFLKASNLANAINGGIYREGLRPRDSRNEDAVVIFTAGLVGEIQTGVVTINIYVPDIDPYGNGVQTINGARCAEVEQLAAEWVESLTAGKSNYKFRLTQTIATYYEVETNQHFVSVKLGYRLYE